MVDTEAARIRIVCFCGTSVRWLSKWLHAMWVGAVEEDREDRGKSVPDPSPPLDKQEPWETLTGTALGPRSRGNLSTFPEHPRAASQCQEDLAISILLLGLSRGPLGAGAGPQWPREVRVPRTVMDCARSAMRLSPPQLCASEPAAKPGVLHPRRDSGNEDSRRS